MGFSEFLSISQLKVNTYNSLIRVRIQALWRGVARETQEFHGVNMILVDDSSDRIHAFLSAKYSDLFEPFLEEGKIITMKKFAVKHYVGDENNRTLRNEKHIYLSNDTTIMIVPENELHIPQYAFEFFDMDELRKIYLDNHFLVDVIGVINYVEGKTTFKKGNEERSHVKFEITDGRMNVKVTFFDALGDEFQNRRKELGGDPMIISIWCAKVNQWEDKINLTNYLATHFYLNANHYSVKALMRNAKDPTFHLEDNAIMEEENTYISTISEIKNMDTKLKGKTVTCQVMVGKVEQSFNWFYNKCTKCPSELLWENGKYTCDVYKRIIPYPSRRFRILAICSYGSGCIPIIFPDHAVKKLIGKCVFELRLEDDSKFPQILTTLEDKQYNVKLIISEENILKSLDVYNATDISTVLELVCSPSKFETEEEHIDDTSMITGLASTEDTPTTGKSTNKGKGRKIFDNEPLPIGNFKNKKNSGGRSLI